MTFILEIIFWHNPSEVKELVSYAYSFLMDSGGKTCLVDNSYKKRNGKRNTGQKFTIFWAQNFCYQTFNQG